MNRSTATCIACALLLAGCGTWFSDSTTRGVIEADLEDAGADASTRDTDATDGGMPDGGDSQSRYLYPGCEDAGSYGCPNLLVFYCGLRAIEGRHNACAQPSDCVAVPVRNCVGALSSCPPAAVNDAGRHAFTAEATEEVWRYCGDGGATCFSSGSCAYAYSMTSGHA